MRCVLLVVLSCVMVWAEDVPVRDLYADTWVATDALGRAQPGHDEVGPPKQDKWVGIFNSSYEATYRFTFVAA